MVLRRSLICAFYLSKLNHNLFTFEHTCPTSKNNIAIKIFPDVRVTFQDRLKTEFVDSHHLLPYYFRRLEKSLRTFEGLAFYLNKFILNVISFPSGKRWLIHFWGFSVNSLSRPSKSVAT